MTQINRLAGRGRVDRAKPIVIRFNGRAVPAYAGDTVASALLANGVVHVGRSFKYHRPRGVVAAGSEEPNALLDVDRGHGRREPNNRATAVEAFDGLAARSQNHWPTLAYDIGAVNDFASPLFTAGFYYKTFMWPPVAWKRLYEPLIRRTAGLGKAPSIADPERYLHRHAHAEVLIIGAGPAGLAAALAASEDMSQRVIVADEQAEFGGALLHDVTSTIDGKSAWLWLEAAIATLEARPNVTLLTRTTAIAILNHNHAALAERRTDHLRHPTRGLARERLWQVRAGRIIVATGAHERPLVFANNDRPGILLADALRCYINRYGVTPGRSVVIATAAASAYQAAIDAKAAGLFVTIVDYRRRDDIGPERAEAAKAGIEILDNHSILGSTGRGQVSGLIVAPRTASGGVGDARTLACTTVGMSGGWTPVVHLASQARVGLTFNVTIDAFVPDASAAALAGGRITGVGACTGRYDLAACLGDGHRAGGGGETTAPKSDARDLTEFEPVRVMPTNRTTVRDKAFVDFQNDVTAKDIRLAVQEGFRSIEHVKRYTTTGMATDQGKTSNINALGIVAGTLEVSPPKVGTTTFRPPYTPTTFGAFAGQARGALFDPVRTTPIHDWAVRNGAVFEDVGQWKRARFFPTGREDMHQAVLRECRAVRTGVGLFDATTLGKIEVAGRDAAEFLNRIYTNNWLTLAPGRCRYGLMLKEDGYIMDDGIVARLSPDRFHVTTTTGGAARVLAHMEDYLQTEFTNLDLSLTSVTEQWAVIAVQGPRARDVIAPLVAGIDLDDTALPHMAIRLGRIAGVPCRLFRVSFTGELGYEINVPSDYGAAVWEALWQAGEPHGITAYGTEAMHVLRAEKGFIIVGQETDGTVTPDDVGLAGLISKSKADFVGKRSLARPDMIAPDAMTSGRKQLVGLLTLDPDLVLDEGAQIVEDTAADLPMPMLGHVTSSYMSPNVGQSRSAAEDSATAPGDRHLGRSIALALIAGGRGRIGTRLFATTPAGFAEVEVTSPMFLDAFVAPREETSMAHAPPLAARRHAFHGTDGPRDAFADDTAGFAIRLLGPRSRWSLRTGVHRAQSLSSAGGFDLSQPINSARRTLGPDGLERWSGRLGPDEWLLIAAATDTETLAAAITEDLGHGPTLVDISHRSVAFEVAGRHAAEILNAGCPLDLGDRAFPPGQATRTVFAKAEIILMRYPSTAARPLYWIECQRSFARYLHGHLIQTAELSGTIVVG